MITWKWVLGALFAVLLMRVGGLITNFWAWVGVVGFLLILALIQTLPAFRRFAAAVFTVGVLVFFAVPALWTALKLDRPILGPALARRSIDSELRTAEWLDPMALRARIGIARYCQEVDRLQGEWLDQRLQQLRVALQPPRPGFLRRLGVSFGLVSAPRPAFPIPAPDVEQALYGWLQVIEQHRYGCRKLVLQVSAKPPAPFEGEKGWLEGAYGVFTANPRFTAFAVVLALLAVATLLIVVRLFQGKPFGGIAVAAAALLVVWLIANQALPHNALSGLALPPPPAPLEFQSLEVPLRKGERVDIGPMIPACTRLTFEVKAGEVWLSRGGGEPERLEGKGLKFPWREPMVLTGDGAAVLWLLNPSKSC